MTQEELAIESLTIRRAPGFATGGFEVEGFSPGVTILHGPNGAGKSTVARSIRALLWPDLAHEGSSIVGQLDISEDDWRVDLNNRRARYQKNGAENSPPSLPSPEQSHRYHLSLHDLLQHQTRDESFAKQIQKESIGGYDLDAAHESLGFDDSPSTRGISEYGQATDAYEEWQTAREELQQLASQQDRLPELERRLEAAREAESRVELLEKAIAYQKASTACAEAEAELAEYPETLADLSGSEAATVADFDERIEDAAADYEGAREQRETAEQTLADTGLPEAGLDDGFITELQERQAKLDRLEQTHSDNETELAKARKRREAARSDLPLDASTEDLAALEPAAWADIVDFATRAERVTEQRAAQRAVEDWLGDGAAAPSQDEETLQRGANALEDWLASQPPQQATTDSQTLRVATVAAVLLAAGSVALALLVNPLLLGTIVVAVGLLAYGYLAQSNEGPEGSSARETHRETYSQLDLEPPAEWTPEGVRSRLSELHASLGDARLEAQRAERRAALATETQELQAEEAALQERREELLETYGVAPEVTDIELVVITKGVLRWQEAHSSVQAREAELSELESQIERCCTELAADLAPYGYEQVSDAAEAASHIRNLKGRNETHEKAQEALERAERTIESAIETIETLARKRVSIYTEHGLPYGAFDTLEDLCDQVSDYQAVVETVSERRAVRDERLAELQQQPGYEDTLLDRSIPDLTKAKEEAEATAAEQETLQQSINEIEVKIDDAKRDYNIEGALEEYQRALDALEQQFETDAAAMVGDVLVSHLREQTEEHNHPEVFDRARELLVRITRGRYELDIDADAFRAYDTVKERGFGLDELSTGTKLQVLLAVRIAFVEHQEQGYKLPLLLDETLANSDDERAEIIIDAMLELARGGRQICYFTAQGDEVVKWQQALQDATDIEHSVIDLGATQEHVESITVPSVDTLPDRQDSLPDPDAHDHESYGEALDVPEFSPRRGAGAAHIWYVVDDLDLLHALLRLGVETWGQLDALMTHADVTVLVDDESALENAQLNGEAVDEFVESWQVGRGKPVDREALDATSAVSDTFIDEVADLARTVDGDGRAIIEHLRDGAVNRFREDKMDELERYLQEEGYIAQREPLDQPVIATRIVNRLTQNGMAREAAVERAHHLFKRLGKYELPAESEV